MQHNIIDIDNMIQGQKQDYQEDDPADIEFKPSKGRRGVIYGYVTTPDDEGKPVGQLKYYDIWSGFRERTTAHGPTHISSARGKSI